jgi:hypothetical protein
LYPRGPSGMDRKSYNVGGTHVLGTPSSVDSLIGMREQRVVVEVSRCRALELSSCRASELLSQECSRDLDLEDAQKV